MQRREYLESACVGATALIAGCAGGDGDTDGGDVAVDSHEFIDPERSTAIKLSVTVSNEGDRDLELVQVTCDVYADNERLDDASADIGDLEGGIQATGEAELFDLRERLDDVTHYTLTLSYFIGDDKHEDTFEYEDFEVGE